MVTGIDDHFRFVVIAAVVAVPSGRAVCSAFAAAMRRYGVPFEVLSDNGKQFTGRHIPPQPVEVLFERICRQNGVNQRLTRPRSPATTGKIERSHKTLRQELLHHAVRFESLAAAQDAIAAWVHAYNHQRSHQALNMATPASVFRPHAPAPTSPSPSPRARMRPRHRCGSGDRATGRPATGVGGAVRGLRPTQWPGDSGAGTAAVLGSPGSGRTNVDRLGWPAQPAHPA